MMIYIFPHFNPYPANHDYCFISRPSQCLMGVKYVSKHQDLRAQIKQI